MKPSGTDAAGGATTEPATLVPSQQTGPVARQDADAAVREDARPQDAPGPQDVSDPEKEAPEKEAPEPAGGAAPPRVLTERERLMLAFERQWWRHPGAKEQAIRDTFELSATRYYQLLNALLDEPAALEHDPVVVGRLRRLRAARTRAGRAG